MPWCDLNFDRYAGKLPGELRDLFLVSVTDLQGSGFGLCRAIEIANGFLEYCNRGQQKCKLIAVYSKTLASMKGTIHIADDLLKHQGWEPCQIGGGSLFLDGIFAVPSQFPTWQENLNDNGLLSSAEESLRYISEYQQLAGAGLLEEIFPAELCPIEPVEVLAVRTP
jgi:hypothetical protein